MKDSLLYSSLQFAEQAGMNYQQFLEQTLVTYVQTRLQETDARIKAVMYSQPPVVGLGGYHHE